MKSTITFALLSTSLLSAQVSGDSGLELTATWSPVAHSSHGRHEADEFRELLNPGVARERVRYSWEQFAKLLPGASIDVGDVFELDFDDVRPFLEQLHPRPRADSHMGWAAHSGVHGVLLARTADHVDVLLRAHVEFELVSGEVFFTVAQFEGRLVVDPQSRAVRGFRFEVPSRSYNFDVHIRQTDRMLIDIGYVPELGVAGGVLPSEDETGETIAAARTALRRAFYPFARLDWMGFADGLDAARARNKPLHLVTIFGQLDDESC